MKQWGYSLSKQQLDCIECITEHHSDIICIDASAGAGKTSVVSAAAFALYGKILQSLVLQPSSTTTTPPYLCNLLVPLNILTYTNKGVAAVQDRLLGLLGKSQEREFSKFVKIGTMHSLCGSWLSEWERQHTTEKEAAVTTTAAAATMSSRKRKWEVETRQNYDELVRWWTEDKPDRALTRSLEYFQQFTAEATASVVEPTTHDPPAAPESTAHYLFVDEVQDTSPQQWQLLRHWINLYRRMGRRFILVLVGDVSQKIFGHNGADSGPFLNPGEFFGIPRERVRKLSLSANFRSTPPLCRFFDRYLAHNYAIGVDNVVEEKKKAAATSSEAAVDPPQKPTVWLLKRGAMDKLQLLKKLIVSAMSRQRKVWLLARSNRELHDWCTPLNVWLQSTYGQLIHCKLDDQSTASVYRGTCHISKGGEQDVVILLNVSEYHFPRRRSTTEDHDDDDEGRTLYVGMTRARSELHLLLENSVNMITPYLRGVEGWELVEYKGRNDSSAYSSAIPSLQVQYDVEAVATVISSRTGRNNAAMGIPIQTWLARRKKHKVNTESLQSFFQFACEEFGLKVVRVDFSSNDDTTTAAKDGGEAEEAAAVEEEEAVSWWSHHTDLQPYTVEQLESTLPFEALHKFTLHKMVGWSVASQQSSCSSSCDLQRRLFLFLFPQIGKLLFLPLIPFGTQTPSSSSVSFEVWLSELKKGNNDATIQTYNKTLRRHLDSLQLTLSEWVHLVTQQWGAPVFYRNYDFPIDNKLFNHNGGGGGPDCSSILYSAYKAVVTTTTTSPPDMASFRQLCAYEQNFKIGETLQLLEPLNRELQIKYERLQVQLHKRQSPLQLQSGVGLLQLMPTTIAYDTIAYDDTTTILRTDPIWFSTATSSFCNWIEEVTPAAILQQIWECCSRVFPKGTTEARSKTFLLQWRAEENRTSFLPHHYHLLSFPLENQKLLQDFFLKHFSN